MLLEDLLYDAFYNLFEMLKASYSKGLTDFLTKRLLKGSSARCRRALF